jgi:hypothetical protein
MLDQGRRALLDGEGLEACAVQGLDPHGPVLSYIPQSPSTESGLGIGGIHVILYFGSRIEVLSL